MVIELRFEERMTHTERTATTKILQQRTKTKWVDGNTTENGYYTWSEWSDVPTVRQAGLDFTG